MRILLSNDDGVHAPGLQVLAEVLGEIAEIDVIAPDRDRSGASNSLTLINPFRPKILSNGFVSVQGTPTDCVHLALTGFFENRPDIVVAGINEGANLGDDVLYSGTVAAAMEARILGIPSIAVSLVGPEAFHFATAAMVTKQLVEKLQTEPLPAATILNVNVPDISLEKLRGFEVARLGSRHMAEPISRGEDGHGRVIYWIGPSGPEEDAGPGTDFHAIKSGFVSVTPLQVDLTNYAAFEQLSKWTLGLAT
jgi:5'-nucleotidase